MYCSSCGKELHPRGLNYLRIKTEAGEHTVCMPCLKTAQKVLRKLKNKTPEEKDLLKKLNTILLVN